MPDKHERSPQHKPLDEVHNSMLNHPLLSFIPTERINNNNLIRSFSISKRSVNTLFALGLVGVNSSIRTIDREYCDLLDGEYCSDREYYIDEDIAYLTFKQLIARPIQKIRESLLPCHLRLIEELDSICCYTSQNPSRCA